MTITTTGGLITSPLVPGGYILVGDATMSGVGTTSVTATALGTLTVTGAGTDIAFTNLTSTVAAATVATTGGAHLTIDALTGISVLSTFSIGDGSTLTLGAAVNAAVLPTIDFGLGSGTLELANGLANLDVGEQITNFGPASRLVFDNAVYTGGSYDNGQLTLTTAAGGTTVVPLASDPAFAGDYFHLVNNGGNTTLVLNNVAAGGIPACYLRGTLILTDRGEVAVEDLAIGDHLLTAAGHSRPIRWIGERCYARRFLASHPEVFPVRIRAGALGPSQPARDLSISPAHAMLLDGVLIPGAALVNGGSIHVDRSLDEVHYYHVELETHDAIWAEGALSETYVDDDNRAMFHNAGTFAALYPGATCSPPEYCAPKLLGGDAVEAVRRRIAGRDATCAGPATVARAA